MEKTLFPRADRGWPEESSARWVALEDRTDRQLDPLGRAALARLGPRVGEHALDIGCGCGQTPLELADFVGASGRVLAVDISEQMLERARTRVAESGRGNIQLVLADAATHSFEPAAFDLVFSRFGVMFFEDAPGAFGNLRRALRPTGRLGFVCWQSLEQNLWASLPFTALRELCPGAPLPPMLAPGEPGPFSFADPARVHRVLDGAGFDRIAIEPLLLPIHLGGSTTLEEAVDYCSAIGPSARLLSTLDAALGSEAREAMRSALEPFLSERGVWLDGAAWVVTADASRTRT
jgi:SAM-dependent methyltransferase